MNLTSHKVIREPLLPLSSIKKIPNNKNEIYLFINKLFEDKAFTDAIFLASPELLSEWRKQYYSNIYEEKFILSILKYYIRSLSNTVPFGHFASYSIIDKCNFINKNKTEGKYVYFYELDYNYIFSLVQFFSTSKEISENAYYYLNDTISKVNDKIRFIDTKVINGKLNYTYVSVEYDKLISLVLSNVNKSSFNEIENLLYNAIENPDRDDIKLYVNQLIESNILMSSFNININQGGYIDQLIDLLVPYEEYIVNNLELNRIYLNLLKLKNIIDNPDTSDITKKILNVVKEIGINYDIKYLINCNLKKEIPFTIVSPDVDTQISKLIHFLKKTTYRNEENSSMESFKDRFYKRYENAFVSLLDVFDSELGVSYIQHTQSYQSFSDLIDDLEINNSRGHDYKIRVNSKVYNFWIDIIQSGIKEVDLSNYDIEKIYNEKNIICNGTFTITYSVIKDKICFKYAGGTSALNLLGRFSSKDKEMKALCDEIASAEENENNYINAEIVHIPNIRAANVLSRNIDRKYEISILSSNEKEKRIKLDDLYIGLKNNQFIVFSKSLKKRVNPYLSSAQNFHYDSLPVYKFLCDLQLQDRNNTLNIDFGGINIENLRFSPRIVFGTNIIIKKASWKISINDIGLEDSLKKLILYVEKYEIPQYVYIYENYEEKMIIDIHNEFALAILVDEIKKKREVIITEIIYDTDNNEIYCNEIISIVDANNNFFSDVSYFKQYENIKRTFPPNDEWVYFKIYTGISLANNIITTINRFTKKLLKNKEIESWFYIRYNDPSFHIRVRFKLNRTQSNTLDKITVFFKKLMDKKLILNLELATYYREIERYGNNISKIEDLFYFDSRALSELLTLKKYDDWILALCSINSYLIQFLPNLQERYEFIDSMYNDFSKEFSINKITKKQIDIKFRKNFTIMEEYFNNTEILAILNRRNKDTILLKLEYKSTVKIKELLWSIIHMTVNRVILDRPRLHELVLYGLLSKYYKRQIGIINYFKKCNL